MHLSFQLFEKYCQAWNNKNTTIKIKIKIKKKRDVKLLNTNKKKGKLSQVRN